MTQEEKATLLSEIRAYANAIEATEETIRIDQHLKDLVALARSARTWEAF